MTENELRAYALNLGISATAFNKAKDKVEFVQERWNKTVTVEVAGEEFDIEAKVLKSKKFNDLMAADEDAATEQAMEMLVGAEGLARIEAMATEEDGTVDVAAIGTICGLILSDKNLKNF